ncbi:hypothetical protein [Nocardia gamkensis]|uniref:Uncharacterized protein n=1 Tax=Nocardia gamkensis TaxID=352869 RepID=A0A7X6R778_9NOCA|nr:hypothetical protein [Nocardia gamkensis]NKY31314.1 hypothetical protein [Nocardia gamkensis]NQE72482.1 hypothetical protein [Nocardia gamkensis]
MSVVIEETHLRILLGDEETAIRPRKSTKPITFLYVTGKEVRSDRYLSLLERQRIATL